MLTRQKAVDPMGATNTSAQRVTFDGRVKLEFHGSKVASDAGLLAYRELDEVLELTARGGGLLDDWRTGKSAQHSLVALLRQVIFQMAEVAAHGNCSGPFWSRLESRGCSPRRQVAQHRIHAGGWACVRGSILS